MRPTYRRTLERAVRECGGLDAVAAHLGVSTTQVSMWLNGRGRISDAMFLRLVDLVLASDTAYVRRVRTRMPSGRKDEPK